MLRAIDDPAFLDAHSHDSNAQLYAAVLEYEGRDSPCSATLQGVSCEWNMGAHPIQGHMMTTDRGPAYWSPWQSDDPARDQFIISG